jgi:hypothetical protein
MAFFSFRGRGCHIALDYFVAGRYANTYASVPVGITDRGMTLQNEFRWETIETSDAYGDSIIDGR